MIVEPIAFFLTISTYGTWLPGDERGWVEYNQGWQLPDSIRELEARAIMTENACILHAREREIVEQQLCETCRIRGWTLHAANCRSNHLHTVISAHQVSRLQIRRDIKAWTTRRLKEQCDPTREQWWAERGSIRWVFTERQLGSVVFYVTECQDRHHP